MPTWGEFSRLEPEMSREGAGLLYHFGVGLGFLATVRRDGGPRLHPMCPLLDSEHLWCFIVPSPKQSDLRRDGRYALHSFPMEDNEDAFYLSGRAVFVDDPGRRDALGRQFVDERRELDVPAPGERDALFELLVERAMLTRTAGHGDPAPRHSIWTGDG